MGDIILPCLTPDLTMNGSEMEFPRMTLHSSITLLSVPSKVFTKILLKRIDEKIDEKLREEQAGFRKGR
jgi:hypothetical protein